MILLLLFIFALCSPFVNQSRTSLRSDSNKSKNNVSEVYKPQNLCNYTLVAPKKVINPYKSDIRNFVPQKPFGSVYLKCAACVAVASRISKAIENVINRTESGKICQVSVNQDVTTRVNEICSTGFKNYDLRKCNQTNLVTDKLKCTEHVKSNMDGGWTKKLRELCNLYTSHMDLEHISNIYANNTLKLRTDLCNGTGIFRDCQNLDVVIPKEVEELCESCDC